jgi:acyl-CoA oxidase
MIIPRCRPVIEAIGHRMVYEAALAASIDPDLITLYETGIVKNNLSWFVESGKLTRASILEKENKTLDAILPRLDDLLDNLNIAHYCTAPIVSGSEWDKFAANLKEYRGDSSYDLFGIDERIKGSRL